jgi:hypothetical protein
MKAIITTIDETGCELKDWQWESDRWKAKYEELKEKFDNLEEIGISAATNIADKYADLQAKYEEVKGMLLRMIEEYERFYTINSMGLDIESWYREQQKEKKDGKSNA